MTDNTTDIPVALVAPLQWGSSDHPAMRHVSIAEVPGHGYSYEVQPGSQLEIGREDFVVTRSHSSRSILASAGTREEAKEAAQRVHEETMAASLAGVKTISMEKLKDVANQTMLLAIMDEEETTQTINMLHDYIMELEKHLDPVEPDPEPAGGMTP